MDAYKREYKEKEIIQLADDGNDDFRTVRYLIKGPIFSEESSEGIESKI